MSGLAFAPFILPFIVFTVIFCLLWAGIVLYRDYVARRDVLEKVRSETSPESQIVGVSSVDYEEKKDSGLLSLFGKIGNRYAGEKTPKYSILRVEFMRAGIRNPRAIPAFWGIKIMLMVALPLIFFVFRVLLFRLDNPLITLTICAALGLAGLYLPDVWLKFLISLRKTRLSRSLPDALDMLVNYHWPGNVRQLKNVVERLVIIADDRILNYRNLSENWEATPSRPPDIVPKTLAELKSVKRHLLENRFGKIEKAFLQNALAAAAGNIAQASRQVGMQRSNFSVLMKKHGLTANTADSTSRESKAVQ